MIKAHLTTTEEGDVLHTHQEVEVVGKPIVLIKEMRSLIHHFITGLVDDDMNEEAKTMMRIFTASQLTDAIKHAAMGEPLDDVADSNVEEEHTEVRYSDD